MSLGFDVTKCEVFFKQGDNPDIITENFIVNLAIGL